jgi:hypothetical protein
VKQLRQIVGLILLVLWVPLTSHCTWENISDLALFKCADDTEQHSEPKSDCADDGCAQLETATYRSSDAQPDVAPPAFLALFQLLTLTVPASEACIAAVTSPAEILSGWQFTFRTALPPRAPSLVS